MSDGYIMLSRGFFKHYLWDEKREFSKGEAWLDLIYQARYSDVSKQTLLGGHVVEWHRGQTAASVRFLKERWGWGSPSKVQRFLDKLKLDKMITIESKQGQNVITLVNFERYNGLAQQNTNGTPPVQNTQQQSEHQDGNATPVNTANSTTPSTEPEQQAEQQRNSGVSETEQNSKTVIIKVNKGKPNGWQLSLPSGETLIHDDKSFLEDYCIIYKTIFFSARLCQIQKGITLSNYETIRLTWSHAQLMEQLTEFGEWEGSQAYVDLYRTMLNKLKKFYGEGQNPELTSAMEIEYRAFIYKETGTKAILDKNEQMAMNHISGFLIDNNTGSDKQAGAMVAWKYILANWKQLDAYSRKRVKLAQIFTDILSIYKQLKDAAAPQKTNSGNRQKADSSERQDH